MGGEDLNSYAGSPRLIRATGTELFDTTANGVAVIESPDADEVVWCGDAVVTCRPWNWRQSRHTQLRDETTAALFILDALDPVTGEALQAAANDLSDQLARLGPDVHTQLNHCSQLGERRRLTTCPPLAPQRRPNEPSQR